MTDEQYAAILDALTAIADKLENRQEVGRGVYVGADVSVIRAAIERARGAE